MVPEPTPACQEARLAHAVDSSVSRAPTRPAPTEHRWPWMRPRRLPKSSEMALGPQGREGLSSLPLHPILRRKLSGTPSRFSTEDHPSSQDITESEATHFLALGADSRSISCSLLLSPRCIDLTPPRSFPTRRLAVEGVLSQKWRRRCTQAEKQLIQVHPWLRL